MKRSAMAAGLVLWSACGLFGGDEPEVHASWTEMEGAPIAVTSLAFDGGGVPIAIAGSSTFGEYFLQRPRPGDGLWERAQDVPLGRHGDRVFRAGDTVYAVLDRNVVRLDDEESFTWTPLGNPVADDDGDTIQFLALAPDEVVYVTATRMVGVDENGLPDFRQVVLAWSPGQSGWTLVPGGEFSAGVWTALVDGAGALVYSTLDGFYRGDAGGVSKIFDCNAPDYGHCESQINALVSDAAGDLTFYVCPFLGSHRAVYRLPVGGEAQLAADIGDEYPYCEGLQALPDGTVFLFAAVDNLTGSDAALFRLAPGGAALELVAALESDYQHAVRDASTVFRYGDGHFAAAVGYRGF